MVSFATMSCYEKIVDEMLDALALVDPDPVDVFEDRLAALLGVYRHPTLEPGSWRSVRVAAIEAAGRRADALASRVARELRGSP